MSFENVEDVYTLSPMQAGMLYHTLADARSGVFVEQVCFAIQGPLDTAIFERTWQTLVQRHPVLRTVFLWDGVDEPLQVVQRSTSLSFTQLDWSNLAGDRQESRLAAFLDEDRHRGFDLSQAPPMRITLVRIAPDRHRAIWSFHHLLSDGWSTPILLQELWADYATLRKGQTPSERQGLRFRDYIAWLRNQDIPAAKRYWQSALAGFDRPTRLDTNRFAPAAIRPQGHVQQRTAISKDVTAQLRSFARQHRLTLNTVVHGAWALLLSRYTGEDDVVYGVTVSGRPPELPGVETAVGMYINTLPCRVRIPPAEPLIGWLQDVQSQHLNIRQFEYSSLAAVQSWSDAPRGQPLFESIVVYENYPQPDVEHGDLEIQQLEYFEQSNYPLALLVIPGETLALSLVHDTSRHAATAASGILRHCEAILRCFAEFDSSHATNATLSEISLLTTEERGRLSRELTGTTDLRPAEQCIHHIIEGQVQRRPMAIAVESEEDKLTYAELDARADDLAQRLRELGVKPDDRVLLLVERSAAMIVGMVGILKAGGAYVPLDPSYPSEHLTRIVADSNASVFVTHSALRDRTDTTRHQVVCLDDSDRLTTPPIPNALSSITSSANLAYVIYTSGSTGQPKGVQISHHNLVHSTTARCDYYPRDVERFLLLSSSAFDSSVAGIFWTLCCGGTLVLPPQGLEHDMNKLRDLFRNGRISHVLCLPSLYRVVLTNARVQDLSALTTVVVAGETCPSALVRQHFELLPYVELYNEYGPTEATVWSTVRKVEPADESGLVPIGRPIRNMHAIVIDSSLQPAPPGVCGELVLTGEGLSRGYLDRPELDDECFVQLELKGLPRMRWYRTGDRACYRHDGELLFLGRVDRQVKIRGFRIELAEIEEQIKRHPHVADAIVVPRILTTSDTDTGATSLEEHLSSAAPDTLARMLSQVESLSDVEVDAQLSELNG